VWLYAFPQSSSPADPSCNLSEVSRLLWTVTVGAAVTGVLAALWPTWRRVVGLVAAALTWAWVDMEGPTLVARGTHGVHFADVPVVIWFALAGVAALRLVLRGRSAG
jgi:hypothetical protein